MFEITTARALGMMFSGALCLPLAAQTTAPLSSASAAGGSASVSSLSLSKQTAAAAAVMPRVFVPTLPRTAYTRYPWKTDITATVFWCGEKPTENNPTPNHKSSWDVNWMQNFGGFDDPDPGSRGRDYCPANFKPGLNPFYIALPYNDVVNHQTTKAEASRIIPWFKERFKRQGQSILKDQWVAIRHGNRVCYAQWSDCGPWVTDDADYVFGNARPKNMENGGAGIDISPAVRDYLGLSSGRKCDWRFVDLNEIPHGPWCVHGSNNHFVKNQVQAVAQQNEAVASRLEELRRLRDEYFKKSNPYLR